jgi:hypothetical protein
MFWIAKLRSVGLSIFFIALVLYPAPQSAPSPESRARHRVLCTRFQSLAAAGIVMFAVGQIARRFAKESSAGKPMLLDRHRDEVVAS